MCPRECEIEGFNPRRSAFCGDCKMREKDNNFRALTETLWQKTLGKKASEFDFDKVLSVFYNVMNYEDADSAKITVYTSALLNVYLSEKRLYEDLKEFNKPKS